MKLDIREHKFYNVFEAELGRKRILLTKNLAPGKNVYGEELVRFRGEEYRTWDIFRSKLAAALAKGISQMGIKPGDSVLYLGAASGTTPSHISDIVGENGFVYALDFAPRVVRDLVFVCQDRSNMAPILADASQPKTYFSNVLEVDAVYQDIAQRNQVEIFIKNCKIFLKDNGFGILCIKARSINVAQNPKKIFKMVMEQLEKEMIVSDYRELDPFEKDHCIFICKKR